MILSDPTGLEKSFAGPPGNKQQLHLASLNPKGKIMGFKAIRDHSTPHSNFLTYSILQQGQTERWGPCLRALRVCPFLAVQLSGLRASMELAELRAASLLCWPWTQPGLIPLPVGPAFKLNPFHQAPSELKLLLCCSHACPCNWIHCSGPKPWPGADFSLVSDLPFHQEPAWSSQGCAWSLLLALDLPCLAPQGAVGLVRLLPCWLWWCAQLPAHLSLQRASSCCFLAGCSSQNLHSF